MVKIYFKSIVSGEDQSILGDVARAGLSLLSKGYKKGCYYAQCKVRC